MKITVAKTGQYNDIIELQKITFKQLYQLDKDINLNYPSTKKGKEQIKKAIQNKDGFFYVASEKRKMIGYIYGSKMNVPYFKSKYFEIDNIVVIPEMQHRGIGQKLLDKAFLWGKKHNYNKVYIECYLKNGIALSFYKKNKLKGLSTALIKKI